MFKMTLSLFPFFTPIILAWGGERRGVHLGWMGHILPPLLADR